MKLGVGAGASTLPVTIWGMADTNVTMDELRRRFEEMYRECEEPVLAYALRRAPAELARDATADAFVAAWRHFQELPDDPLPWLIGATRKTLANQRRAYARQERLTAKLAREPLPTSLDAPTGEQDAVLRAFSDLSERDREALTLIAWEGLTPAQAARALGCSPVAFRVRLHRARRRLEQALRDEANNRLDPRVKEASCPRT